MIDEAHDVAFKDRKPCPSCGSTSRTRLVEVEATVAAQANVSAAGSVERGLNDVRLAVLGILVGIALSVGFGVQQPWPFAIGAAVATFAGSAALIRWRWSRNLMMAFMHWLTGQ